jgi:FKBP-type peptidyl-prolyl cis-trans isomerase FklB
MKKPSVLFVTALLAVSGSVFAQDKPPAPAQPGRPKPEALEDRASYIIGLNLGQSLKSQNVPVAQDLIIQGLRDGLGGADPLLTPEEIQAAMQEFQQKLMAQQEEKRRAAGEKNLKESQTFLEQNKTRPGVKTTASGLQYEVLKEGSGDSPKPTDKVTVNYRGTLPDGKVFDSSYDRGQPVTFPVNGVIPGWVEALQLMKPGAKYKIYLPPALGYGERGAGNDIGPNQALVFEVELISVDKTPAKEEPAQTPTAEEQKPDAEKPPAQ